MERLLLSDQVPVRVLPRIRVEVEMFLKNFDLDTFDLRWSLLCFNLYLPSIWSWSAILSLIIKLIDRFLVTTGHKFDSFIKLSYLTLLVELEIFVGPRPASNHWAHNKQLRFNLMH
ncbi:hypothetical protein BpHYR1_042045 [Brachionus plicatilis]|uniref:Uncharacterized protein n=1 Tax=Brachionus plicatilis TaxID=10195 RepID=A0A3M7R187_BRAPC|nr:hypothetical protein BpHYR1_042045 [Brachionus plicatilis]